MRIYSKIRGLHAIIKVNEINVYAHICTCDFLKLGHYMKDKRLHILVNDNLYNQVHALSGERGISEFIRQAIEEKINNISQNGKALKQLISNNSSDGIKEIHNQLTEMQIQNRVLFEMLNSIYSKMEIQQTSPVNQSSVDTQKLDLVAKDYLEKLNNAKSDPRLNERQREISVAHFQRLYDNHMQNIKQ